MTATQIDSLSDEQVRQLHELYQHEWWTAGRTLADVQTMLQHSDLVIGLLNGDGDLVGFARVLTDFVYHATVYDVIVKAACRDAGLGRVLMDTILNHPRLERVNVLWLGCLEEMVPFYRKFGFTADLDGLFWMRTEPRLPSD